MPDTGTLPGSDAALAQMRDLQTRSLGGLQGLMARDTTAKRKALQDAMYKSSEESINRAADLERRTMLEGTFGRGVGASTIAIDLADRLGQTHRDALSRAAREAFVAAGAEDRADLAAELGVANAGFGAATTGMQADMNVILQNLARQQQESQFSRDLGFRENEGAANRAQQANLFSQDLGFRNSQLAQQNSQFMQDLGFRNRQLSQQDQQFNRGLQFQGSENAANRSHQTGLQNSQFAFQGSQNQATRDLQRWLAQQQLADAALGRDFTASQNALNRAQQADQFTRQLDFTGGQNQASRDLQRWLADQGFADAARARDFTGSQAQLNRDQQMQMYLMGLANQQDIAGGNLLAGGMAGAGDLIGRLLQAYLRG